MQRGDSALALRHAQARLNSSCTKEWMNARRSIATVNTKEWMNGTALFSTLLCLHFLFSTTTNTQAWKYHWLLGICYLWCKGSISRLKIDASVKLLDHVACAKHTYMVLFLTSASARDTEAETVVYNQFRSVTQVRRSVHRNLHQNATVLPVLWYCRIAAAGPALLNTKKTIDWHEYQSHAVRLHACEMQRFPLPADVCLAVNNPMRLANFSHRCCLCLHLPSCTH